MMKKFLLQLFLIISGICFTGQAQPLQLFHENHTEFRIIIPEKVSDNELVAAQILASFLNKISGTEFMIFSDAYPVVEHEILIGNTKQTIQLIPESIRIKPSPSGFYIAQHNGKLIIMGGNGKGVIHGVTWFLETFLGVEYLSPTVQIIPEMKSFEYHHADILQNPATEIRIVNGPFGRDSLYRYFRRLDVVDEYWANSAGDHYYVHTFTRLVPPEKYFDTHPEYFSLINGERVKYGQLCLSNPDLVSITINTLREAMKRHPGKKLWSVSQNDNFYSCQCDPCRHTDSIEGSPSGTLLRFVNQIARAFPDQTITTLAYQYTRKPPAITRPDKNVLITHCSIELNRSLPIEEDPGSRAFVEELEGWSRICDNIKIWDYEVQFTNYLCPFPLWHTLQPNIQMFNRRGTKAHFQQCNAQHGVEFAELKSWLMSHLLWNSELDADSLIKVFMASYYEDASPYVLQYFDLLQAEAMNSGERLDIYGSPVMHAESFLSAANISRYNEIFDQAEKRVSNTPELLERVKIARLPVTFSEIEIAKTDIFGERGWYYLVNGKFKEKLEMRRKLDTLYAVSVRNKIPYNENGVTAQMYYENSVRTFSISIEGNQAFGKPAKYQPEPAPQYTFKGPAMLTNGVSGHENWKLNWLGWEGKDVEIEVDLLEPLSLKEIIISTLNRPDVWILHPAAIDCMISVDGSDFTSIGKTEPDQSRPSAMNIKDHVFKAPDRKFRYIRFAITGTKALPGWHAYSGQKSWVFLDEIKAY